MCQAGQKQTFKRGALQVVADRGGNQFGSLQQRHQIGRRVECDDGLYRSARCVIDGSHARELAACGFPDQSDAIRVNPIFVRVFFDEPNGGLDITNCSPEPKRIAGQPVARACSHY
jgi:hypothetical protein